MDDSPDAATGGLTEHAARRYAERVAWLASPEREGRLPGTPEMADAAAYLQRELRALHLGPLFDRFALTADGDEERTPRGSFRQTLELGARATVARESMTLHLPTGDLPIERGFDVLPLGGSRKLERAPVVFAGFAIASGPDGYLGFPFGVDMHGKAALVLRYEPMDATGRSLWTGHGWTPSIGVFGKVLAASRRGADAVVLVTPPRVEGQDEDDLLALRFDPPQEPMTESLVASLGARHAAELIDSGDPRGRTLPELVDHAASAEPIVELKNVAVSISGEVALEPVHGDNIGAVLPGRGALADEYILIGAHYDHLGRGARGTRRPEALDTVHPGADDNASGVAGVLLAAERLTSRYDGLGPGDAARSIAFVLFTAQEPGNKGSEHYVRQPPVPLGDHALMINLDMIGSLSDDGVLEVNGLQWTPEIDRIAEPVLESAGMTIAESLTVDRSQSDHAPFDDRGVPNVFFFTGFTDRYHTPDDTFGSVDVEGGARVAALAADVAWAVARYEGRLGGRTTGGEDALGRSGGTPVRVGLAPAADDGRGEGVRVARVFEDTAAGDAGLRAGDRIISWGGQRVSTVEEWSELLAGHSPGDRVRVDFVRRGEKQAVMLRLRGP